MYSRLVARQLARKQNVIDEGNISGGAKKKNPSTPADNIDSIMEDLDADEQKKSN